ncbi:MAG: P27 family phage terminase small subunit [Nostocoides sp.]
MALESLDDRARRAHDELVDRWANAQADIGRLLAHDVEAYCGQVALLRECQERVSAEGVIIAGPKGEPMPHPAVEIGRKAQVEIRAWAHRFDPPDHLREA